MAENQKIQQIDCTKVPEPTLRRLPWYLSNVKLLKQRGERFVSSTQISKEINIDASDSKRLVVCEYLRAYTCRVRGRCAH
mgnify:CR=1 FL=1